MAMAGCAENGDMPPPEPGPLSVCDIAEQAATPRVEQVAAGSGTACAVTSAGHMYCWGYTGTGIAGHPEGGIGHCYAYQAPEHRCLRQVALDVEHGCGTTFDHRALCWGSGWLGDPEASGGYYPNEVPGLENVTQVGAKAALLSDRTLRVWGIRLTEYGSWEERPIEAFPELDDIVSLPSSGYSACAVRASGRAVCWGGALIEGLYIAFSPRDIAGIDDAVEITQDSNRSCVRVGDGSIWCWGVAPLGDGTTHDSIDVPVRVLGVDDAVSVSTGGTHACAVRAGGEVLCWGGCVAGACGPAVGTTIEDVLTPVVVEGVPPAIQVAVGFWFTCALTADREIYCWGDNSDCQVGVTTSRAATATPHKVGFASEPLW